MKTSYAILYKKMAPTNVERFIKLPYSISRATTIHSDCCHQPSGQITLQSVLINKPKFLRTTHHTEIRKIEIRTEVHGGGGFELVRPAREQVSSRPKPCASLEKPHESCPFTAPCLPS